MHYAKRNHSSSRQLLLTTVNSDPTTAVNTQNNSTLSVQPPPLLLPDNDRILHVINEFLAKLGGPSPMLSAKCSVCQGDFLSFHRYDC